MGGSFRRWGVLMATGAAAIVEELRRVLDDRARREADVKPARVVGRRTDGRTLLQGLDGECISSAGSGGYSGELVVRLPSLLNRDGTVGSGVLAARATAALLWVDSIEPASFARGATLEVTVTGSGFTPSTEFEFLLPASEEVHPGITVDYINYVDSEHMVVGISVAADAELVGALSAPLAFDDPALRF